jgi:hypothetical protein
VTAREEAERVLQGLPEESMPAALEALEAALEGKVDTSVAAILARHGESRLSPAEFERHFGDLPSDGEG